jgi:hypothetical protein
MDDRNLEREDQIFKRACAEWHLRFSHDLRQGRDREADALVLRIGGYAVQWRDHLDGIRRKLREAQADVERFRRIEISAARRLRLLGRLHVAMRRGRAETGQERKQASGGENGIHTRNPDETGSGR